MTQEIIDMARQAGFFEDCGDGQGLWATNNKQLEAFAKLVAAKERKEICGTVQQIVPITSWAHELLDAIRAKQ